ncbi:hypothetical protein ACFLWZ_00520 [Chloroflexota bacterium]
MNAQKIKSIGDFLELFPAQPRRKAGNGWLVLCPAHNDKNPSLWVTPSKNPDFIADWTCQAGCSPEAVLLAKALTRDDVRCNSHKAEANSHKPSEVVRRQEYIIRNASGELIATHIRLEYDNGEKSFLWERNGVSGLGGLKVADLPLFNSEKISKHSENTPCVICEGEKPAAALENLGILSLGTVTGASSAPGIEALRPVAERSGPVHLWADNDPSGKSHMEKIASRLQVLGKSCRIIHWTEAPAKGDAADFVTDGSTLLEVEQLVRKTSEWKPEEKVTAKKPKDTEGEVKETSFLTLDHSLYEQIVSDNQAAFIEYDCNACETRTVTHIMQGEVKVVPLSGEEITLGAVKLPSGVTEYGSTLSLLQEVESHIYRYLDVSHSFRKFAAYYVLLSWVYDRFNTLPYLRFIGDTGCGKSRALDVCGGLCYKPTSASGCITPAPIYRMLKRWAGTIILDEADLQNSDEYHEVTKILNCGFERNRPVIRAVKENPDRLQILPTFGPKVFATRRRFKDAALEARCLTEIMQETARDDISATLTSTFYKEQETLRNKLLLFRFRNYNRINSEEYIELDLHGIEPRLRQISACFAALFAGQPDVLADYRAFIGNHQKELIEQRAATTIGQVVEKLFALMVSVTNVTNVTNVTTLIPISSGNIAEALNKNITPQAVGQILKTLGLQTCLHKIGSTPKRYIVFDQVKLDTLKKRYIPVEDDESVTKVTMVTTTGHSMPNVTGDLSPYPEIPCPVCAGPWAFDAKMNYICADCSHPYPGEGS